MPTKYSLPPLWSTRECYRCDERLSLSLSLAYLEGQAGLKVSRQKWSGPVHVVWCRWISMDVQWLDSVQWRWPSTWGQRRRQTCSKRSEIDCNLVVLQQLTYFINWIAREICSQLYGSGLNWARVIQTGTRLDVFDKRLLMIFKWNSLSPSLFNVSEMSTMLFFDMMKVFTSMRIGCQIAFTRCVWISADLHSIHWPRNINDNHDEHPEY